MKIRKLFISLYCVTLIVMISCAISLKTTTTAYANTPDVVTNTVTQGSYILLLNIINNHDAYLVPKIRSNNGRYLKLSDNQSTEEELNYLRKQYSYRYSGAGPLAFAIYQNTLLLSDEEITDEYIEKNNAVYTYACDFAKTISGLTDQEKVDAIVKHLYEISVYDATLKANGIPAYSYAYNILFEHRGSCGAYANAFCIFCDAAGLKSYYVSGSNRTYSTDENHVWNTVTIDGILQDIDISRARVFNNINAAYINASAIYNAMNYY